MILLKNGYVVIDNQLVERDILIEKDIIIDIKENIILKDSDLNETIVYNCEGCLVMPGAVDVHVHLREPGFECKETIKTGTLSSSKGGVTTIMAMPNLNPCPDCLESLEKEIALIKKDAYVNVYPYGAITVNEEDKVLADIESYKDVVYAISDDGRGVNNLDLLEKAMILAKKYDLVIASHAEDNEYKTDPKGEYLAVYREIELAKKIGCRYHFCHLSTKESFDAIRKAHIDGFSNITCEITPHHLVLNKNDIVNGNFKMNPPLRDEIDQLATVKALVDGTASMVATDHAPHTKEEKMREYDKCLNGIIGLETLIPIIYSEFVRKGLIDLNRFLDVLVYNPIKVFKLPERRLEKNFKADIAVIDIINERKYTEEEILSKGVNSPFIGKVFTGFCKYTFVNGKLVYQK